MFGGSVLILLILVSDVAQVFSHLFEGPTKEILDRTYDVIIVGGTSDWSHPCILC